MHAKKNKNLPTQTSTKLCAKDFLLSLLVFLPVWRIMEEKRLSVGQEDKTEKSKQGGNKGQCGSCCHHRSREHGERVCVGGATCRASSCSCIELCVYITVIPHHLCSGSLLQFFHFISGLFIKICLINSEKSCVRACGRAPFEVFEIDPQDKSAGRMR